MLKLPGVLVGLYAAYAVVKGEVHAKSGVWGRSISRAQSPEYFWIVIVAYFGLAIALLTVF